MGNRDPVEREAGSLEKVGLGFIGQTKWFTVTLFGIVDRDSQETSRRRLR